MSFVLVNMACAVGAQSLADSWKFIKADVAPIADVSGWETVQVPHSWNAVDGHDGGAYYRGPGWYQTDLDLTKLESGKRVFLRFNAVGTAAEVFLDQQSIGSHLGGYSAFAFEITDRVKAGSSHELRVRADNTHRPDVAPLSGDFTICGGIHRPVELLIKNSVCISPLDHASPGVFIFQDKVDAAEAELRIRVLVDSKMEADVPIRTVVSLMDAAGKTVTRTEVTTVVASGRVESVNTAITVDKPHLWHGLKDPYLYDLKVELFDNDKCVDQYSKRIGLRSYHIDAKKGFYLNGKPYQLRGVNIHQDRAVKGAAVSEDDIRDDFDHIREIGANALRLAHYPHSSLSYELCDEMGILAWAEIPLVNQVTHDPGFAPNARQQLLEMIRQHGNHCSIFTWSLSNEMYHKTTAEPMGLLQELNALSHAEDPTRLTTLATNYRREPLCCLTDIVAFNNYPGWYGSNADAMAGELSRYNKVGASRGIGVSEYGAGGSILHQDLSLKRVDPGGEWHPEQWQAYLHERQYSAIMNAPYCWGSFVWAMFDFSSDGRSEGDRPGVNDKGLMTHDRKIRKDVFYFYSAQWSREPVLHLTSKRYRIRNTSDVSVKVYTNLKKVTLSVNGKALGDAEPDALCAASWKHVQLQKGSNQIKVSGMAESGKAVSDETIWVYDPTALTPKPMAVRSIVDGLCSASNVEKGRSPKDAFDGNAKTRWASDKRGAWLARELSEPAELKSVGIQWFNGEERAYIFEVQTSTDGNTWRSAYKGKSRKTAGIETYTFDAVYELNHIRIICNGWQGSSWSSIVDVQLDF